MEKIDDIVVPAKDERELWISQLTSIEGIGKKIAEAFYESGIRRPADLAPYLRQHTAEEISLALKEHGVTRSAGLINKDKEAWIRQAEMFNLSEKANPASLEGDPEPKQRPEETLHRHGAQEHDEQFTVWFDVIRGQR